MHGMNYPRIECKILQTCTLRNVHARTFPCTAPSIQPLRFDTMGHLSQRTLCECGAPQRRQATLILMNSRGILSSPYACARSDLQKRLEQNSSSESWSPDKLQSGWNGSGSHQSSAAGGVAGTWGMARLRGSPSERRTACSTRGSKASKRASTFSGTRWFRSLSKKIRRPRVHWP